MPHFEFTGASVVTGLKDGIGSTDLAATLNNGSGWPTGADGKVFTATLGDKTTGQAQEKILCSGRTNENLTIVERGYDGTAPQSWGPNTRIAHSISGVFAAEASDHIHDDTRDDHGQYHNTARHAAVTHTLAMMGAGSVGTTQLVDDSVTQPKMADDSVGTPQLIDGSVVAGPIPNLAIVTGLLADDSVTGPKLADAAIDAIEKFVAGLQPFIVQGTDPGAVGANKLWFNTNVNKLALLRRNAGNSAWEVIQTFGPGINYTPTLYNFSVGPQANGGYNSARYRRHGRTIIADGFVQFGTGAPAISGQMAIGLPVPCVDLSGVMPDEFYFHGAARGSDVSTNNVYGGVGVIGASTGYTFDRLDFIATAGGVGWNANTPFPWNGQDFDRFSWFCEYEAASAEDANFV